MLQQNIKRFYSPPPQQSFFLFGPRGTGKSSFLKQFYPKAQCIDFLDPYNVDRFSYNPEALEPLVKPLHDGDPFILDEVQKVPSLLSKIHQIMESHQFPKVQFIMTGSSARKLKVHGVDLLAGRALITHMYPFMASELGDQFKLEKALKLGLLPLVLGSPNPAQTLKSYVVLYIREEVKQEGLVRNLSAFSRFLHALSFSHGEVLNLNNVSRDCNVKRSTLDRYIEIVEDLLLGYRLPPFKKQNRKATISSSKFYYFDSGVYYSLREVGPLDDSSIVMGAALEGLVLQNLKAWISYRRQEEEIFFWRTTAQNEVDFIIYGPNQFKAIEVKNSSRISPASLRGLLSFGQDYPLAEKILLYRGKQEEIHKGIRCIPVERFLKNLKP
ncbi:MAG: ATP-binding protein [Bdellovibrio sp.]|nr:MAG: ATP-binding protein [Bdellovibrio sp.]